VLLKLFIGSSNTWVIVKAMVFPVVTHECESWTIKKAEHRRTDAFELGVEAFQSPLLLTRTISHDKLQDVLTGDEEIQPSLKCHSLYQKLFHGLLSKSLT